jgi:large subunit ribosomal protein L25
MQETFEINAEPRSDTGKGASRRLRRTGQVPGIVYGAHRNPSMIALAHNELVQHLEHEAFYSHVLSLKVGSQAERVVLKDLQRHPSKPFVLHVDFQRVAEDEKLKLHVPLHFVGEEVCPGVKQGGIASHTQSDLEVACLPKDLPEYIEVDISALGPGESLRMSDLKLPEGVEIVALSQAPEHDLTVVSITAKSSGGAEEEEGEEGEGEL